MTELAARFTDGKSAAEHRVTVSVTADRMSFEAAGTHHVWPAGGLELIDRSGGPRLAHGGYPEARLTFDKDAEPALTGVYPAVMRQARDSLRVDLNSFAKIGVATVGLAVLIVVSLPALSGLITTLIPLSYERELGEEGLVTLDAILDGAGDRCTAPEGGRALARMTDTLLGGRDLRVPVDVRVVPVKMQNAVALPGGILLIFQGLLDKAGSAEEVAGVLAHEVGHAQFRHGMQRLVQSHALSALVSLIAPGDFGGLAGEVGTILVQQSYSRDAEREADDYAVDLLNAVGVKADGMAEFFERLADQTDSDTVLQYLSSHPLSVERARDIRNRGTGERAILSENQWEALKQICSVVE